MVKEEYPMLDLFEKTPDLVCIVDRAGWFRKINPAVVNTLGYSYDELLSRPVAELIHPEDRETTASRRAELLNNNPLLNFQNRYIAKSGAIVWLEWTSVYIPESEVVFAIAKNITRRKEAEIEIEENYKKYKNMAAHFKHHVEKDRLYFTTELHEEIAQLAAVIKMDLELVSSEFAGQDGMTKKRIEHGIATTQMLIDKIRKLSYSINPARIEDLGLDNVLRALCHEFSSLTGIPCNYKSSYRESLLEHEVKLDLLRICQEALLNVMYHAEASDVSIKLEEKKNKIKLTVADNGRGFSQQKNGFGLTSMQDRADSINGELSIQSEVSKGTKVSVSVGIKEKRKK